jgi:hypothetical protein
VGADRVQPLEPAVWDFARRMVELGCRSVVCLGRDASHMEDAFLDVDLPDDVHVFTKVMVDDSLEEALWHAWYVPRVLDGEEHRSPVIACFRAGDSRAERLRALALRLRDVFERLVVAG